MRSRLGSAWESAEAGGSPGAGECAGFLLPGSCSDCQCCVCLPVRCAEMFALLVNTCNFVNTINTWAEPHNATGGTVNHVLGGDHLGGQPLHRRPLDSMTGYKGFVACDDDHPRMRGYKAGYMHLCDASMAGYKGCM